MPFQQESAFQLSAKAGGRSPSGQLGEESSPIQPGAGAGAQERPPVLLPGATPRPMILAGFGRDESPRLIPGDPVPEPISPLAPKPRRKTFTKGTLGKCLRSLGTSYKEYETMSPVKQQGIDKEISTLCEAKSLTEKKPTVEEIQILVKRLKEKKKKQQQQKKKGQGQGRLTLNPKTGKIGRKKR